MFCDLGESCEGVEEPIGEVDRVGRGEADALDPLDGVNLREEIRKVDTALIIGAYSLPKERELPEAFS